MSDALERVALPWSRRSMLRGLAGLAGGAFVPAALAAPRRAQLVLAGPSAIVSAPLIHMVESGALASLAERVEFTPWRDPDQLRVMALEGKADVLATPTNVAANLHNRGAALQLLNVAVWGVLWIVTQDEERRKLADYRGEEIAVPFRGDMPDIVLQLLAAQHGLDLRRDLRLRYVPTPMEAMQLLLTRRVRHALLAEPAVSMALRKARSLPVGLVAPSLYRGADLQQAWGQAFGRAPRIPQAGIVATGGLLQDADALTRIRDAYARSLAWCRAEPMACGQLMSRHIDLLTPEAVADSIAVSQLEAVPARDARAELTLFFEQLQGRNAALIGGRLPAPAFYGLPAAS
ncbi:MAG: ABC transporter substrate-binding protein [Burkholderiaceae bacterium]